MTESDRILVGTVASPELLRGSHAARRVFVESVVDQDIDHVFVADHVSFRGGAGMDALITGEGAHHTYFDAMELGLNVYYAGHYATETWGVRALALHLETEHGLDWEFLDFPTGM